MKPIDIHCVFRRTDDPSVERHVHFDVRSMNQAEIAMRVIVDAEGPDGELRPCSYIFCGDPNKTRWQERLRVAEGWEFQDLTGKGSSQR